MSFVLKKIQNIFPGLLSLFSKQKPMQIFNFHTGYITLKIFTYPTQRTIVKWDSVYSICCYPKPKYNKGYKMYNEM